MTETMSQTTDTINMPGAKVVYDVVERPGSAHLPLMLIGQPMGASGFAELAKHFDDRTIITYDPRGAERSAKDDPGALSFVTKEMGGAGSARYKAALSSIDQMRNLIVGGQSGGAR